MRKMVRMWPMSCRQTGWSYPRHRLRHQALRKLCCRYDASHKAPLSRGSEQRVCDRLLRQSVRFPAALLLCGLSANAQEANRLQDIQVQSLPGQRVELKLILSGTAPEPLAFTIEDPARIALDLPETALGLSSRRRDVNIGPLDTVLTADRRPSASATM